MQHLLTSFSLALSSLVPLQQDDDAFAWRSVDPYVAPDFERYFPDDEAAGRKLDELYDANTLRKLPEEEFLAVIRAGLRHTTQHRTLILSYVGNRLIWGVESQHPGAIELCYHAADFREEAARYGCRHYAVYFGLSVVKEKTPAILHTLADLAVAIDDPNDIGRIAWGAADQIDALLPYLEPHLKSEDPWVREKAQAVERIFRGELRAFDWAAERAKGPPRPKPHVEMPEVREALRHGDGATRLAMLGRIGKENLVRDMDDTYLPDFAACAEDPDPKVREQVAIVVGGAWIWRAGLHRLSDPAVDLMLRLSRDPDPDVRYRAVYYGLSTYRGEREDVLQRMVEMATDPAEARNHARLAWGLERHGDRLRALLDTHLAGEDAIRAQRAWDLHQRVFEERPTIVPPGIAAPDDLVGTWVVRVLAGGSQHVSIPPLRVVQDEAGILTLAGHDVDEADGPFFGDFAWVEVGETLYFSFHTRVETAIVRTTGKLTGDQIEGMTRIDGDEHVAVWTAKRQKE